MSSLELSSHALTTFLMRAEARGERLLRTRPERESPQSPRPGGCGGVLGRFSLRPLSGVGVRARLSKALRGLPSIYVREQRERHPGVLSTLERRTPVRIPEILGPGEQ